MFLIYVVILCRISVPRFETNMLRKIQRHNTGRLDGGMIGETVNGKDSKEIGRRRDLDILIFCSEEDRLKPLSWPSLEWEPRAYKSRELLPYKLAQWRGKICRRGSVLDFPCRYVEHC